MEAKECPLFRQLFQKLGPARSRGALASEVKVIRWCFPEARGYPEGRRVPSCPANGSAGTRIANPWDRDRFSEPWGRLTRPCHFFHTWEEVAAKAFTCSLRSTPTELSLSSQGKVTNHPLPNICQQRTGNNKRVRTQEISRNLCKEKSAHSSFLQLDKLLAQVRVALLIVLACSCHHLDDKHSNRTHNVLSACTGVEWKDGSQGGLALE